MAKVFISHSWKDNDISRKIAHELKKDGAKIWIDYARIKAGDTLPERISNALEWCDTLVLVWSKAAAASYWVKKEWQSALTLQKEIIPCIIDDTPLPAILCSFVYINFKNFSQGYEELLRALDLERIIPPIPMHDPPIPIPFKKKIPTKQLMKIAAIIIAILILGFSANYVVQKIAAAREAKRNYWAKRQIEMNTSFQQAQQSDGDAKISARDKIQTWWQFSNDFAKNNPFSKDDDKQLSRAADRMSYWRNQVKQDSLQSVERSIWDQWQREMSSSFQQASRRDNLSSLTADEKVKMWQDFLTQYARDNPYSGEDNDQLAKATDRKNRWLNQAREDSLQAAEKARRDKWQREMNASYEQAKQRDQNKNLHPDSKVQTWQNFITSFANDNPFSTQDNEQRQYAKKRITYWTNYKPIETKPESKPKEKTVKGMTLVFIPGGTFDMGDTFGDGDSDEKPVHSVTVSNFYISNTEVTNAQYAAFLNAFGNDNDEQGNTMIYEHDWGLRKSGNRWQPQSGFENHPVVYVTWYGADRFAKWAGCSLPTEAEWEYAAREGGKKIKWSGTNNESSLGEYAWYYSNSGGKTHAVRTRKSNALGLYDMSGNVWEWCADWYDENYYKSSPQNNPKGPSTGTARLLRGGSWSGYVGVCRSTNRGRYDPDGRYYDVGFRVVQDSPQ